MSSEAKKRADNKYRKENAKQIILRFYPADMQLYEYCKELGTPKIKEIIRDYKEGKQ